MSTGNETSRESASRGDGAASRYAVGFAEATPDDHAALGGKCAGLAALIRAGCAVPPGFAVTTLAYAEMVAAHGLAHEIALRTSSLPTDDVGALAQIASDIGDLFRAHPMPAEIGAAIRAGYEQLCERANDEVAVAVRSSGTAEDLPEASFAGQGDTYLWTVGADAVIERVKDCWASLFSARAMAYRAKNGFGQLDHRMAVGVQTMVNARAAGVAMSLDPANGDRSKIVIESTWGLGEPLVSGQVTPDCFVIDKVLLEPVKRTIAPKLHELVADPQARRTVLREVEEARQLMPSLSDAELRAVARAVKAVEKAMGVPQDIEWAIDAQRPDGEGVVLLQSRPETVWSNKKAETKPAASYATGIEGVLSTLLSPLAARDTQQQQSRGRTS
jgi:pyruvate,water dikinase